MLDVMNRNPAQLFFAGWFTPPSHWVACALITVSSALCAWAAADAPKEEVFKLRDVSVFSQPDSDLLGGQRATTEHKPSPEVKNYPAFISQKPIYGSVRFDVDKNRTNGALFHFAIDESQGTGKGYNRLYFDLNHDLDLRNDPVVTNHPSPPDRAALPYNSIKQQVIFNYLSVPLDFGPDGQRPVQIMPRLTVSVYENEKEEYKQVTFVRTQLYEGDINIGGQKYLAWLGNDYVIVGRLDVPSSLLQIVPKDSPNEKIYWWGGDRLLAAHKIQGKYFTFSASPRGDQLVVHRYQGDLGIFEVGRGGRNLDKLTMTGSLQALERAVPVGGAVDHGSPTPMRQCQIPVGDYLPSYLTIEFGRLQIGVSHNYHADGLSRDRGGRPLVYGIAIRKERPFVLDFSNKPDVMFAAPAKNQRIKVGDTLEVKAVLIDPILDVMIRRLQDTRRKQTKDAAGKALGYERPLSLDPQVIITRANGVKVAEGVMPFG